MFFGDVSSLSRILSDMRCKVELSRLDSLVADLESALEQEFSHVTETKLATQFSENCHQHDTIRKLEIVERCPGVFVEVTSACAAVGRAVAQGLPMPSLRGGCGQANCSSPCTEYKDANLPGH